MSANGSMPERPSSRPTPELGSAERDLDRGAEEVVDADAPGAEPPGDPARLVDLAEHRPAEAVP
jgi:hypothetical protein